MTIPDIFKSISERLQTTATVKTVYGEPIVAEGKTIVPVARVRYGFGAGGGRTPETLTDGAEQRESAEGSGGGGGVEVSPVGFIEITPTETRYVSFEDRSRVIKAALLGLVIGVFLLRRRRKR